MKAAVFFLLMNANQQAKIGPEYPTASDKINAHAKDGLSGITGIFLLNVSAQPRCVSDFGSGALLGFFIFDELLSK